MSNEESAKQRNHTVVIEIETGDVINGHPSGPDVELPSDHKEIVAWAASSPGCVYVQHGGVWRRVCFP